MFDFRNVSTLSAAPMIEPKQWEQEKSAAAAGVVSFAAGRPSTSKKIDIRRRNEPVH